MLTYNHYNDFILKLNDELKTIGIAYTIKVNTQFFTHNEIIELNLSNLKIVHEEFANRSYLILSDKSMTLNYGNALWHIDQERFNSDNGALFYKITKKVLASLKDDSTSVYKIPNVGFYAGVSYGSFSWRFERISRHPENLNESFRSSFYNAAITQMLEYLNDTDMYNENKIATIFNTSVVKYMRDIIKIKTYPYDIADLDLFSCKDSDKSKVFLHNEGMNHGYFYIDKDEEMFFKRCIKSDYILVNGLKNFFNETNSVHHPNGYQAISNFISTTLPKCMDCSRTDYSSLGTGFLGRKVNTINTITLCELCEADLKKYEVDLNTYQPNKHTLNSYSFKQKLTFSKYGSESVPLYLGVELEVDEGGGASSDDEGSGGDNSIDSDMHDYNANIVLQAISKDALVDAKTDGSLNNGFEMVSHPTTLAKHLKTMQWKKGFDLLTKMGYASHNTSSCGLHVHINKDFFGKGTAININGGKIAYLLEKNRVDFIKFTRRRESALNRWAEFRNLYAVLNSPSSGFAKTKSNLLSAFRSSYPKRNKYIALNTMHDNTFEFRIFRGTLNHDTFTATLQLVDNLSRLVKDIPNDDTMFTALDSITFDDIVNYRPYNELSKYWESRKGLN